MFKLLTRFASLCLLLPALALGQIPTTPNIGLQTPPYGTANWNTPVNYNSTQLDLYLSGNLPIPALTVTGSLIAPGLSTWNSMTTYGLGTVVFYSGTLYESLIASNTGNVPSTSPSDWSSAVSGIVYPSAGVPCSTGSTWCASYTVGTWLQTANNLSDVQNAATALANLGAQAALGYTPLRPSLNLSDLTNAATARGNLGLGSASTQATSAFDAAGAAAAAQAAAEAFSANASNLASGTVPVAVLPPATTSTLGVVRPDNTTITETGGVLSAVVGGSGTVSTGTASCFTWYSLTGTTVGPNCNLTASGSALTSLLPIVINDGNPNPAVILGVGGPTGPNLTAAAGAPTGCGSTWPIGSHDANSTGVVGSTGYDCSGAALAQNVGPVNQSVLAQSNAANGTLITDTTFNTYLTLSAASTVNSCSFYLGHYTNAAHHIGCGIATAPSTTTTGTTVLCYAAYSEVGGPVNSTITLPLTGCGTLTAGNYWMFLVTDDGGWVSAGLTNCGGTCAKASYEGTSTWTFGSAPVITSSALAVETSGLQYILALNVTPTGTPWIPTAPVGVDVAASGQVQGIEGVPLTSLGAGPLGLDTNGMPRIMPLSDYPLSATNTFGNSTDYPSGRQIVAVTPTNAGVITGLNIINTSLGTSGSCTTAPTFNVFVASTSNVGTAQIASATAQTTVGTITQVSQNLPFGAGQVIGVYVSVQGGTCLLPIFTVVMQYSQQ